MSHRVKIIGDRQRNFAHLCIDRAEVGSVVTISPSKRSTEQNAKMWAMLNDVAKAAPEGRQWTPEAWKSAFMHSLGHQVLFAQALDGSGPFPVGFRSSRLGVKEMADLITCIQEYGDRQGIFWQETEKMGWAS